MKLTKIQKTVKKTVQESQYEPFASECMVEAVLQDGDNVREVGDYLYDVASLEIKKDILRRAAEADMEEDAMDIMMGGHPVVVEEKIADEEVEQ